jgi:predicted dehydrogenase
MIPIRVGIIGCGEVTQVLHLPSLYQFADKFAVTALCDVSVSVMDHIGAQWGVAKRYTDYQTLLAQDDVDVVLIANPHAYHAEVTLAAIAAGKHALVEKPMCMTLREADAIITAAQAQPRVVVQVGYMRRYAAAFVEACRLVPQLGAIRLARVHDVIGHNVLFTQHTSRVVRGNDLAPDVIADGQRRQDALTTEAIGDAPPDLRTAYSVMLGLSSHDLSAMRELLGMPQRVLYAAQRNGGLTMSAAFDYGDFVCQFETGIDSIPRFDAALEVYGEQRMLRVEYNTPYVRNLPIKLVVTEANGRGGVVERVEQPEWGDPFVAEWEAFYDNITQGRAPKTSPADFRHDLELFQMMIAAMWE